MTDDLGRRLEEGLDRDAAGPPPNLADVINRGRRIKLRRATMTSIGLLTAVAVGWAALAIPWNADRDPDIAGPGPAESQDDVLLYEEVSELTRAEIFAFRALAHTDLMDPYGARTYNWTYEEDTTQTEDGWRVGFAASDCLPKDGTFTCTGLSGEDPADGNALTDTYIQVALNEGQWQVLSVRGNIPPEDQERVVGYSLLDEREPSHWDFAAVGLWRDHHSPSMTAIWVGPYPTEALGSACTVTGIDAGGQRVGPSSVFYQEAPNRPFERGGGVRSGGISLPREAVDAVVECEQYTGPGWEIDGEPELIGAPGEAMGVSVQVKWVGDERFTGGYECHATILDDEGQVVWEDTTTGVGIVSPNPKQYPYRTAAFLSAREPVDAEEVGEVSCRTL